MLGKYRKNSIIAHRAGKKHVIGCYIANVAVSNLALAAFSTEFFRLVLVSPTRTTGRMTMIISITQTSTTKSRMCLKMTQMKEPIETLNFRSSQSFFHYLGISDSDLHSQTSIWKH